MKKAVVVGGSSGIGLSIASHMQELHYFVYVVDKVELPADAGIIKEKCQYLHSDLRFLDVDLFENLASDDDIDVLFIAAGIGRVEKFADLSVAEVGCLLQINTASTIEIMSCFRNRISNKSDFYCGVMGSIAGWISSPLFSVYGASKAAIANFVESINIELEMTGFSNRVFNVSPGFIAGTAFYGEKNKHDMNKGLAKEIVSRLFKKEELFIPEYDEVYAGVIKRYNSNPHKFGMDSFNYKMQSGRVGKGRKPIIGYMSGTFDLFHIGHLNLVKRAKNECDYLIVGVHPNAAHKGKETFIPFEERKEMLRACKYVDEVVDSCPEDSDAWLKLHYNKLFVGSDYKGSERFNRYEEFFKDKDVKIVYFPYTQSTSSTQIRGLIEKK